jgi:hypothetical protein
MAVDTYRSLEPASAALFEALLERHTRQRPRAAAARAVVARRAGRVVAGAVASLLGGTALWVAFGTEFLAGSPWARPFDAIDASLHHRLLFPDCSPTLLLLTAWPVALVAGWLAAGLARLLTARSLDTPAMPPPAVPTIEIVRLEDTFPLRTMGRLAAWLEGWSAAAPLAALSLTAPLTIHALVALWVKPPRTQDFDSWIGLSALLVGLSHLALAFLAVRWGRSLRRRESGALRERIHWHWAKALLVAVGASLPPSFVVVYVISNDLAGHFDLGAGVLALIPAGIAAVTGLVFVPAMYLVTARRIAREREILVQAARE